MKDCAEKAQFFKRKHLEYRAKLNLLPEAHEFLLNNIPGYSVGVFVVLPRNLQRKNNAVLHEVIESCVNGM
jgi:hypothetical protein